MVTLVTMLDEPEQPGQGMVICVTITDDTVVVDKLP